MNAATTVVGDKKRVSVGWRPTSNLEGGRREEDRRRSGGGANGVLRFDSDRPGIHGP